MYKVILHVFHLINSIFYENYGLHLPAHIAPTNSG